MLSNTQRALRTVLATLVFAAIPAVASPITVTNFSFETLPLGGLPLDSCGTGCLYSIGPISGWSMTGSGGQFQPGNPGNTTYFTSLSDGATNAYDNSPGAIISQTVAPGVVLGEVYTLRVDLGFRLDAPFTASADLLINGNTYTALGVTPTRGTFGTYVATYTGSLADVGKSITIELKSGGSQANFDNVRLDGVEAPEPASFLLMGAGFLAISLRRRSLRRS